MRMPMIKKILNANKWWITPLHIKLNILSLRSAAKEQNLENLSCKLSKIIPDLTDQYTLFKIDNEYSSIKTRTQHAFQITMALKAIQIIDLPSQHPFTIVDVGDSSGSHLSYLRDILMNDKGLSAHQINFMSVNLDPVAIDKILAKGFDGKLCRAEDLYEKYKIKADLLISFQMLEHLYDPISFLNLISKNEVSEYFVVTVPYVVQSRVGLYHIRQNQIKEVFPENTHIFELSPDDWKLIFRHSGWRVVDEMICRQYPQKSFLRLMKHFWKYLDFEGFYGAVLVRDRKWAEQYKS